MCWVNTCSLKLGKSSVHFRGHDKVFFSLNEPTFGGKLPFRINHFMYVNNTSHSYCKNRKASIFSGTWKNISFRNRLHVNKFSNHLNLAGVFCLSVFLQDPYSGYERCHWRLFGSPYNELKVSYICSTFLSSATNIL